MLKLRDLQHEVSTSYSVEGIDHQYSSTFGAELEVEFKNLKRYDIITDVIIKQSKLSKIIKEHTNMDIILSTEKIVNAYVYPPDINRNNPIITNIWHRLYYTNKDADELLKNQHYFEGSVNLQTGKVSGEYANIVVSVCIGSPLMCKGGDFKINEVTAILLHELGHVMTYFEMLSRITATNYIMVEGTRRLFTANTKEQRVLILEDIEEALGTKIDDKDQLAIKQKSEDAYRVIILHTAVKASQEQLKVNLYDTRAFEQLADQFVSRHGYARSQALALDRLYRMHGCDAYNGSVMHVFMMLLSALFFLLQAIGVASKLPVPLPVGIVLVMLIMLYLIGNPLAVTYDPPKKRILKLQQQINDALKDTSINKERKSLYLKDYYEIQDVLAKMHDNMFFYEWLWSNVLPWGRSQRKLIEVQEELEALSNNNLFTAGTELDISLKNV